jgi:hypothetical protein
MSKHTKLFNECLAANQGKPADIYMEMFNSADSEDLTFLLKEFHRTQSTSAGNALTAKLDDMLSNQIELILK